MSESSRAQAPRANWWKVCAALPAVAMIGGGIALTAQAEPTSIIKNVAASNGSPAIVVPEVPLTIPSISANPALPPTPSALPELPLSGPVGVASSAATAQTSGDPVAAAAPVAAPLAPALVVPSGIVFADSRPTTPDGTGIPVRALEGYRLAVSLIDSADPDCNLDWALLAAIGSVESNHARFGGNQLDSAGVAQPGIIGIPLNGSNGTARITDSDGGLLDRDNVFDRAVGPMQFIPSTWRVAGADADGDGVKNPQSMADAAAASAIYLCSGPGDLSQQGDLRAAILRYNASDSYVQKVTGIASMYRLGVDALPASDLPVSDLSASDLPASDLPGSDLRGSNLPASDLPRFDLPRSDLPRSDRPARSSAASTPAAAAPAQPIKAVPASAARRSSPAPTTLPSARKPAATPVAPPAIPRPSTSVTVKPTPTTPKAPIPASSTQTPSSGTPTKSPSSGTSTPSPTPAASTPSPTPAAPTQSPSPAAPAQSPTPTAPAQSPTPAAPTQSPSPATSTPVPTPCVPSSGEDDRVARLDDNSGRDPAKC